MIGSKERRCSPRLPSSFPVRYRTIPVAGNGYVDAFAEDLSPEGVRFWCRDEIRARSGMLLELRLPDERSLNFFGRAAWVRELPDNMGFEVGGRFEDQSTWGRKTVERFLQHDALSAGP